MFALLEVNVQFSQSCAFEEGMDNSLTGIRIYPIYAYAAYYGNKSR